MNRFGLTITLIARIYSNYNKWNTHELLSTLFAGGGAVIISSGLCSQSLGKGNIFTGLSVLWDVVGGWGGTWQGRACMAVGMLAGEMATKPAGTHPTGMHSCFYIFSLNKHKFSG